MNAMTMADTLQDKSQTRQVFDAIAHQYDKLNRLLSMGIDRYWRRVMVNQIPSGSKHVADIATGTGDVIQAIINKKFHDITHITGVDPSNGMLDMGKKKFKTQRNPTVDMLHGVAERIPLKDNDIDCVTMAFGIRNVPDVAAALTDIKRVLKPGGRVLILEFSLPKWAIIRVPYLLYFRKILPWIGTVLSRHPYAYRYLNKSVEQFPYGSAFAA